MSKLVSKDEILKHLDECIAEGDASTPIVNAVLVAVKCAVEQMPTVDAVPVVRCKDCESAEEVITAIFKDGTMRVETICKYHNASVVPDWFCWNGKKKGEAE